MENSINILLDIPQEDVLFCKILPYLTLEDLFTLRCVSRGVKQMTERYLSLLKIIDLTTMENRKFKHHTFSVLANLCKNVYILNFSNCKWLNDNQYSFYTLFNGMHKLVYVNLSNVVWVRSSSLQQLILNCPNLSTLLLAKCNWLTTGAVDTLTYHQNNLKQVDFSHCQKLTLQTLLKFIKKFQKLEVVSFAHVNSVIDPVLISFANYSKNLKCLNLSGCRVSERAVRYFRLKHPNASLMYSSFVRTHVSV